MNISMDKLLQKMEEEIQKAKEATSDHKLRERIQAIKTLCELVLEDSGKNPAWSEMGTPVKVKPKPVKPSELLDEYEDGNEDSLFDF